MCQIVRIPAHLVYVSSSMMYFVDRDMKLFNLNTVFCIKLYVSESCIQPARWADFSLAKKGVVFEYSEKAFDFLPRNLQLIFHLTRHQRIRIQKRIVLLTNHNI